MILYCDICKKQFHRPPSKLKSYENRPKNKHNFCSRKCYVEFWKKEIGQKGNKHWKWQGGNIMNFCANCQKRFETERKGKNRKYKFCSKKCLGMWLEGRFIGTRNPNWKGSPEYPGRQDSQSMNWKKSIYKRDDFTCQKCGSRKELNAHHLKGYTKFPKLRYKLSNGITLCRKCHIKTHKSNLSP